QVGASSTSPAKHFFVEGGTIQLIRGQPDLVAPAQLARFLKVLHLVARKPEPQSLFHEMVLVQILSETQDAPHEIGADFNGRFPDAARKFGRFFHDQETNTGILPKQQRRSGRARKSSADDYYVVMVLVF